MKHTFLYQIIVKGANGIQPVFQMFSEKQDRKHPKIKDLFVRCTGLMSSCDNVEDFNTDIIPIEVICKQKRAYLFGRIKSFTFTSDENDQEYDDLETINENEYIRNLWTFNYTLQYL